MTDRPMNGEQVDVPNPPDWNRLYGKHFPSHTCPSSRHCRIIADDILRDPKSPVRRMLIDAGHDPDDWAHAIEETVGSLWKARAILKGPTNERS